MMPGMTPEQRAGLARMFLMYADREFHASSPCYDALARACAHDPELAEPLLAAPAPQQRALLYFAAVQYLLRRAHGARLADWYPTLGGTRMPDEALVDAFAAFIRQHRDELRDLCARRTTQTNEASRAALLRPALGRVARAFPGRAVSLIDLGTSAGLLLYPDRYGYDYSGHRTGAPDGLLLRCELRGGVPDGLDDQPEIAERTGLDLTPLDAGDPATADWLRACLWPEHTDRLARLDAALAQVAADPPRLLAGDLRETLGPALDAAAGLPVVQASNVLTYLPDADRRALVAQLDGFGRRRDLAVVVNEAVGCGAALFAGVPAPAHAVSAPTVVTWRDGRATVEVLGTAGPHAAWLDWCPTRYDYAPQLP
jgi:hypothetical protein